MSGLKFKFRIYIFLLDCLALCLFLVIFYKISKLNEERILDNHYLKDLINNWSNKPIRELYIAKSDENCDKNILNYEWQGVPSSCDCKTSYNVSVKGSIYEGKCSVLKSLLGCQTIKKINPQKTENWKNGKICVREYELDFSETITVLGTKCPKHYVLCGIDTKNFSICFPRSHGCPINYIKFSNSEKKPSDRITHTLKLNDDWFIHYSNKFTNNTLIIDVKYTEGRVCINPKETNIKNTHLKFKKSPDEIELEKEREKQKLHLYCFTKIGKSNFDERYIHLDSNSKFKFFTDNSLTNLMEKLPQLHSQDFISQTSSLYFRSYIHWSPFCRQDDNLNPDSMLKDISKLILVDSFYPFIEFYLIYLFILYFFELLFTWILQINEIDNNSICTLHLEKYSYRNLENFNLLISIFFLKIQKFFTVMHKYLLKTKFILVKLLIFSLAAFTNGIIFIIFLNEKNNNINESFVNQKCGDIITNDIFFQLGKHVSLNILNNYQILLYSILLIGAIFSKTLL